MSEIQNIMTQMGILADELNVLKTEFIGVKSSHANMHQASVNQANTSTTTFTDHAARLGALEDTIRQAGGDLEHAGPLPRGGSKLHRGSQDQALQRGSSSGLARSCRCGVGSAVPLRPESTQKGAPLIPEEYTGPAS